MDFTQLAAALLGNARSLLQQWLPAGKVRGHEFVVGDLAGKPGDSLSINISTGKWSDFAAGDKGGDLISLYAAIHHISQGDAAAQLGKAHAGTPKQPKPQPKRRQVIAPVPANVPACPCHHHKYGKPSHVWEYRDAGGALLGYVARYDLPDKGKEIVPWTYGKDANGKPRWGMGSWADPRPLYGLDDLAARPEAPVLIVEGEKSADAARKIIKGRAAYVVVTWPGGSQAWRKAGWKALAGREVLLWPDADDPGIKCMFEIGRMLLASCRTVKVILADDRMDGWDAADALAEGWDWQRLKEWAKSRHRELSETGDTGVSAIPTAPIGTPAAPSEPQSKVGKWMAWGLDRNGNGDPAANLNNAVAVLEHDSSLEKSVWYDAFLDRMLTGVPAREWKDFDDINLALYMQRAIGLTKLSRDIVSQAVIAMAYRDTRNCVKDWLDALKWDGEPRIDHFFEDYFGAAGTEYTRAASRNFWISMCARVYQPGCKVDNMIILEGGQGIGKSRALQVIAGPWFAEQHESASNLKGFGEILQGKLIVEISEMDSFSRTEVTRVKAVVSNSNDRYRGSYKHYAEDHPRQCVFVGTTNKDDWNRDETGARRFWPIHCSGDVDIQGIAANREQLFAEAARRLLAAESHWQMPEEEARVEQRKRFDADAWLDAIAGYLGLRTDITVNELLIECLGKKIGDVTRADQMRVASCLRAMAWQRGDERVAGLVRKVWRPANG